MKPTVLARGNYVLSPSDEMWIGEKPKGEVFIKVMYSSNIGELLKDTDVNTYRLFFKLLYSIKPMKGSLSYFHLDAYAADLGIKPKSIYRPLAELKRLGIIRKVKIGHYMMNPHFVWSGHPQDRLKACQEWDAGCYEETRLVQFAVCAP